MLFSAAEEMIRIFAELVPSKAEALRMTMLRNGLIYRVSECQSRVCRGHVLVGALA